MNIFDYADILNLSMTITYHHNQDRRFSAKFDSVEVREGQSMLKSEHGNGVTPEEAIRNYAQILSGAIMIYSAYGDDRFEKKVPPLEYP